MKTLTQELKKEYLKFKLRTSEAWALRALELLYSYQTQQEKASEQTINKNDVGFSGADSGILSSFAKQYQIQKSLSPKQMTLLFRIIPRYWKQTLSSCSLPILETQMREDINKGILPEPLKSKLVTVFTSPLSITI